MPSGLLAGIAAAAVVVALVLARRWRTERRRAARLEQEVGRLRARLEVQESRGAGPGHQGEEQEREREVARLRREVEQADEAREVFFDLVTHELRSPLAAILGYQELLADGAYGGLEDAGEPVDRIGRSARHLLHLIDGVVELSRIRAASVVPDIEHVNLGVVLATAAETFRTSARERGLEPRVAMPDSFPTIRSDQDRIIRALDLLITSAVKYPAANHIHLDIQADGDGATVRVHPTEIDTREDTDDPAIRLGLRLAVARGIAGVIGGQLDLERDDGPITAVTFRIRHHPGP